MIKISRYEDNIFLVSQDEYGWKVIHKESGKSMGVNYKALPENSCKEYVLGYCKCLALEEGWIKI